MQPRRKTLYRLFGSGCVLAGLAVYNWFPVDPPAQAPASPAPSVSAHIPAPSTERARTDSSGAVSIVSPAAPAELEQQWMALQSAADSSDRRRRMHALIKELAIKDPTLARSLALKVEESGLRRELVEIAVSGWASIDFEAAVKWAREQSVLPEDHAHAAIINGASNRPDLIVAFSRQLSGEQPERRKEIGGYLIRALGRSGRHETAAAFALEGTGDQFSDWIVAAYTTWGYKDPETAVLHAIGLNEPRKRLHAFRAAASGWAQSDPRGLMESARTFPEGPEKSFAMTVGLRHWVEQDAAAVARWVASNQR